MGPELEITFYKGTLPASAAVLATVPAGEDWIIDNVILTNTTAVAAVVQVNTVPSGGSAAAGNALLSSAYAVPAAASGAGFVSLAGAGRLGEVLRPGDQVYGGQTTSGSVTARVTGRVRQH
jgi:hypothetical protein